MSLTISSKESKQTSDLNIMVSDSDNQFARVHRIDQAIFESEQEILNGAESVDAGVVFAELEKKYHLRA